MITRLGPGSGTRHRPAYGPSAVPWCAQLTGQTKALPAPSKAASARR